ncbi:MAG TPA: 5'/3'-nucleotidase SurE [Methylomirabilota bacterium]
MRRILVTNDDGVHSPGIRALADALRPFGEVLVVAPLSEASAIGHALTLRRPLRIETVADGIHAVDGTPTDCVNIAIRIILNGEPPAFVASGINKGYNLGDDVTYSGTVAGALEAALLGIPSMAVSLGSSEEEFDFGLAAEAAARVADAVLASPLPPRTFLNVNVPPGRPSGQRVTVQGRRNHETSVTARVDPRGRSYYWIDEAICRWHEHPRSDYQTVREGLISVTPLQPDLTAHAELERLEGLLLPAPPVSP